MVVSSTALIVPPFDWLETDVYVRVSSCSGGLMKPQRTACLFSQRQLPVCSQDRRDSLLSKYGSELLRSMRELKPK